MPDISINGKYAGEVITEFSYSIKAGSKEVSQEIVDALIAKVKVALQSVAKPPIDSSITVNVGGTDIINESAALSLGAVGVQEDALLDGIQQFKDEFGG